MAGYQQQLDSLKILVEQHHGAAFATARPEWLRATFDPRHVMELDLYNEELGVAYMLHGASHREFNPLFHPTQQDFVVRQNLDTAKAILCAGMGIKYVVVPHPCSETEMKALLV